MSLLSSSESASLFFLIVLRESRKVSVLLTTQIHKGNYRGNWSPYIPRNLILRYTDTNDTVLDQMAGSGTTLVECRLLQRNAIGIDINPGAVMVARNRLDFSYTPLDEHTAPQRTQSQCNIFLCVLCALCGELNNENQPHSFFSSPAAPFWFTLPGCPSRSAPPALVVWGAGRRFSILPAGFGCEVGMDAWVELYSVVVCGVLTWLLKYIIYIIIMGNECKEHLKFLCVPLCSLWFELNYCPPPNHS
ncbi:MAG: DNA methyltransferase, partial [Bacteroidales bacterium]|nr:DNA methyltransferase [Bacteroidales bacterium]